MTSEPKTNDGNRKPAAPPDWIPDDAIASLEDDRGLAMNRSSRLLLTWSRRLGRQPRSLSMGRGALGSRASATCCGPSCGADPTARSDSCTSTLGSTPSRPYAGISSRRRYERFGSRPQLGALCSVYTLERAPPRLNFTAATIASLIRNAALVFIGLALLVGGAALLAALIPSQSTPGYLDRLGQLLSFSTPTLVLSTALLAPLLTAMLGPLKTDFREPEPSGAEQFDALFTELISTAREGYQPLVFFIDELDRAPSSAVVSVLQTMTTFLNQPGCVFIVAADQAVLENALREAENTVPRHSNPYYSGGSAYLTRCSTINSRSQPCNQHG